MNSINDWGLVVYRSFGDLWVNLIEYIPVVLAAIVIFLLGIFIAKSLGRITAKLLKKVYLDKAVQTTGLKQVLEQVGFKYDVSLALGFLVKWFLYAVVLVAASDILGLSQISEFLNSIVYYIPNVIIAVIILIVGVIISNFAQTLVKETATAANIEIAQFLSDVARWAILIFTVMAALIQLNIATQLTETLFTGVVFMIALAGGIAFGLGGKEKAKEIIDKLSKN